MKKYVSISLVLFAVFFGAIQVHAMTLGEFVQQTIQNGSNSNQTAVSLPADITGFVQNQIDVANQQNPQVMPSDKVEKNKDLQQVAPAGQNSSQPAPASEMADNKLAPQQAPASSIGVLKYGQKSDIVMAFQKVLVSKGLLSPDNVTGYYGPATAKAVRELQKENGIDGTGEVVGPQTQSIEISKDDSSNQQDMSTTTTTSDAAMYHEGLPEGCIHGATFSALTGVRCVIVRVINPKSETVMAPQDSLSSDQTMSTTSDIAPSKQLPKGCIKGALFSALTGAKCVIVRVIPVPGCDPNTIYSRLTGKKCVTDSPYDVQSSQENKAALLKLQQ